MKKVKIIRSGNAERFISEMEQFINDEKIIILETYYGRETYMYSAMLVYSDAYEKVHPKPVDGYELAKAAMNKENYVDIETTTFYNPVTMKYEITEKPITQLKSVNLYDLDEMKLKTQLFDNIEKFKDKAKQFDHECAGLPITEDQLKAFILPDILNASRK